MAPFNGLLRELFIQISRERPRAVIDAKYKAEKPAGYPNADLYQMLAYCTALRLSDGHLVYAKGSAEQRPTASVTRA